MTYIDSVQARQFAIEVVRQLRAAGHQALWAGGCVRDQLMGQTPKDYDVATDAPPERIREVFGKRRTLPIGAAFGVITVLGPKGAGQIDVATFRRDAAYSDGRHPDSVSFSDAEHDAQRRDFTINGLFFDPLEDRVIDYVGGQTDLQQKTVRAIGEPLARIAEDKLRMLRAIRFAARFGFTIEPATFAAIQQQAHELVIVSAERVATEMGLILSHPSRARGVELLRSSGLLEIVLPEVVALYEDANAWPRTLEILAALKLAWYPAALAALLREIHFADPARQLPRRVFERWKLSNDELHAVEKLLVQESIVRTASNQPWPKLQRVLVAPQAEELLGYSEAVANVVDRTSAEIDFCKAKLALPVEQLNPPLLITGDDLKQLGIPPGPQYRELLERVRDAQLDGEITTADGAKAYVAQLRSQ